MELYIIGAGNVGGFIAYHAYEMGDFQIAGFIDDDIEKLGSEMYGHPVVGTTNYLLEIKKPAAVVIAIANPVVKEILFHKVMSNPMLCFPNFIHPKAWIGYGVIMGRGNIIYPGVSVNYETMIHNFCTINLNSAIGHNSILEDFATLSPGVNFGGFTHVSKKGFVGIGATSLQGTKIGYNAVIGGQTMLLHNAPDYGTVVGNPNRLVRTTAPLGNSESSQNIQAPTPAFP